MSSRTYIAVFAVLMTSIFVSAATPLCAFADSGVQVPVPSELTRAVPETAVPDASPRGVSKGAVDGILSGIASVVKSGVELCVGFVRPVVESILPTTTLPQWVFFALGFAVFSLVVSSFLSIPVGLVVFALLFTGYLKW